MLEFAAEVLAPGGTCLLKLIKGGEAALMPRANALFDSAGWCGRKRPVLNSSEVYLLARDRRRGPPPD